MPGEFGGLESRNGVWLAIDSDGAWWWGGPGVDTRQIDAQIDQSPTISPNGLYVAFIDVSSGEARLTGFDTQPAGEGFGVAPIDNLPTFEEGVALGVAAVTDEGDVIVQGRAHPPDVARAVRGPADRRGPAGRPAGPAGDAGRTGRRRRVGRSRRRRQHRALPRDHLRRRAADRGDDAADVRRPRRQPRRHLAIRSPAGTIGGDVTAIGTLRAQKIGASGEVVLEAPEGWGFAVATWAWEDDENLVATLLPDREGGDAQLVRCNVTLAACAAVPVPSAE